MKVRTLIHLEVFLYYRTDTLRIFYSVYSMIAMVPNPNLSGETPKNNPLSYDQVLSNTLANITIKSAKLAKILRECYDVQHRYVPSVHTCGAIDRVAHFWGVEVYKKIFPFYCLPHEISTVSTIIFFRLTLCE